MKLGIARLWHEANSFAPTLTGMDAFRSREWTGWRDAPDVYAGTATEIGGALAWAAERPETSFVFSRCASAPPGGAVEQAILDRVIDEIATEPAFEDVDGIYLSLHGACIGTGDENPEATLLSRLRERFADRPIAASFDIHMCPDETLARCLDAATIYRTYPHVDMDRAAVRALDMLERMIATGRRPRVTLARTGYVLPSHNMRTVDGAPMRRAQDLSLAIEAEAPPGEIFAVYPYGSFAYADTEATDSGALVTAEDAGRAGDAGARIAAFLTDVRGEFVPAMPSAADIIAERPWRDGRRTAILEPADNPLSGGLGDTPGLFAAAIGAGLPPGTVFAFFNAPDLVARAAQAGIGATLDITLGARLDDRFGGPVPCTATVLALTDGRFRNAGPMERGMAVSLGPTAMVEVRGIRVIITSSAQSPNDMNYFALHGIDLATTPLLLAKAKNHFMAAFGEAFDVIRQCDTPGPAMADATQLPFRRVPARRLDLSQPARTP